MQDKKPVYEWSITKKQRRIVDYLVGNPHGIRSSVGMVFLVTILTVFLLICWTISGESFWKVFRGVAAAIIGTAPLLLMLRIFAGAKSPMESHEDDNETAERYSIFDDGIEIITVDKTPLLLKWNDIRRAELYSNTPWYYLQVFWGYIGDTITVVSDKEWGLDDLVIDNNPQKKEILNYIKSKIALNPPSSGRKSFRMYNE